MFIKNGVVLSFVLFFKKNMMLDKWYKFVYVVDIKFIDKVFDKMLNVCFYCKFIKMNWYGNVYF